MVGGAKLEVGFLHTRPRGNMLSRSSGFCTHPQGDPWQPSALELSTTGSLAPPLPPQRTHWVTPPKLLSTTKAVIFSFTAPVAVSVTGVLAKTVKMSARPPLLWKKGGQGTEDGAVGPGLGRGWRGGRNGRVPDPNLASVEGIVFSTGAGHS